MAYKALYREWRPMNFAEVIGQDHISITLQNAISSGRIAHAYLFSGPRGTGKTSSAKIFAKALNCQDGPTPEPCNHCEVCIKINQGTSLDVIEIDAASNRGIDEIRDLREKIKFAPSEGRYKVYIIDEVHMLTTEAFNALLKTLEEPPSKVVFILATTEPHKIPATILSRVQRFDFKRIGTEDIIKRLQVVVDELPGEVDPDALLLIARKAEGGMRDALSLLDQCYSDGKKIDRNKVVDLLGSVSEENVVDLTEKVIQNDIPGIISILNSLMLDGRDSTQILRELTEHLRNLLIIKTTGTNNELVYASKEIWPKVIDQSSRVDGQLLIKVISLLIKAESELRYSLQPRISLEVALINACTLQSNSFLANEVTKAPSVQTPPIKTKKETVSNVAADKELEVSNNNQAVKELTLTSIKSKWKELLDLVKKAKIGTYAFLVEGRPLSINGSTLMLGFAENHTFHRDKIEQPENRKIVEQILFNLYGYSLAIKCITISDMADDSVDSKEDLVSQTYQIFGQDIVEIKE